MPDFAKVRDVFDRAVLLAGPERAVFLETACGHDAALRAEVERLLAADPSPVSGASLSSGARLGPYEILAPLGAGGMGEVYKALDTRLDRQVAIKVLPRELMSDAAARQRLEREARAAAALAHPHICTLLDIGCHGGIDFLVLEYLEGDTLAARLRGGKLPFDESLRHASDIAEALATAHRAGIVHRDLKPANIMLTPRGAKLLDFGLARQRPGVAPDAPTTLQSLTRAGMIVGTLQYMAPEQLQGQDADERSDVFAFGAVLYEMVTGRRPFEGTSEASVIASILRTSPPAPSTLEPLVSTALDALVARCLAKDRGARWPSMDAVWGALVALRREMPQDRTDSAHAAIGRGGARRRRIGRGGLGLAGVLAALGLAALVTAWPFRTDPRMALAPLAVAPLTSDAGNEESPSFSPDGTQVAYSWNGQQEDNYDIYVRLVDAPGRLRLTTDPAEDRNPTFSPDGRWIGFVRLSQGRWMYVVIPAIGGTERVVAELPEEPASPMTTYGSIWSSAWLPDGRSIVLNGLRHLSLATGELSDVTTASGARVTGWFPAVSPDGTALAFVRPTGGATFGVHRLAISPDGAVRGEPRQVAAFDGDIWGLAWTADGRDLVFAAGRLSGTSGTLKFMWRVSAAGGSRAEQVPVGEDVTAPAVSSRGHLAFVRNTLKVSLWRVTVPGAGQPAAPHTRFAYSTRNEWNAQYSPDGRRVAFESNRTGESAVWVSDADGASLLEVFSRPGQHSGTPRWSPDGRRLAFDSSAAGNFDIYVIEPGSAEPLQLTTDAADDAVPSWSPDGRWIYFFSRRTGRQEIWKVPSRGGPAIQVTREGGACAFPSADGTHIFYTKLDAGSALWTMPSEGGPEREVLPGVFRRNFVVFEDGLFFVPTLEPDERFVVHYLDFSTGAVHPVAELEGQPGYGLAVSPNRRHVLYSRGEQVGRDLMLVNGFR